MWQINLELRQSGFYSLAAVDAARNRNLKRGPTAYLPGMGRRRDRQPVSVQLPAL
jgi:hypothetical protein